MGESMKSGELRPYEPKCTGHQQEEQQVRQTQHPRRKVIKQQFMKPLSDEPIGVHRLGPERRFPSRQGTPDAEYTLGSDDCNQEQVDDPKVEIPNKAPTAKVANPNDRQRTNVKNHDDCVKDQYHVG